ncbi:MAG: hypothetical protein LQ345_006000 [Seirophora villosa]|nr:MAG: hypothetical protein LQ345_006000 [Seirophora villosa]
MSLCRCAACIENFVVGAYVRNPYSYHDIARVLNRKLRVRAKHDIARVLNHQPRVQAKHNKLSIEKMISGVKKRSERPEWGAWRFWTEAWHPKEEDFAVQEKLIREAMERQLNKPTKKVRRARKKSGWGKKAIRSTRVNGFVKRSSLMTRKQWCMERSRLYEQANPFVE